MTPAVETPDAIGLVAKVVDDSIGGNQCILTPSHWGFGHGGHPTSYQSPPFSDAPTVGDIQARRTLDRYSMYWSVEAESIYLANLETCTAYAKILRRIHKLLVKSREDYGTPKDDEQFIRHFAKSVGATWLAFKDADKPSSNRLGWVVRDVDSGASMVSDMFRSALEATTGQTSAA